MRAMLTCAFICGTLALSGGVHAKVRVDQLVIDAQPYVEAALNTSMGTLIVKATQKATARDQAYLGLAMFAGRSQPADGQEALYAQKLEAMETRLLPQSDDYLNAHPDQDVRAIDWDGVLKPSPDELLVAIYYQQRYSADYWLGQAMAQRNMTIYAAGRPNVFGTGSSSGGSALRSGSSAQGALVGLNRGDFVIRRKVLMTAAACVRAVRIAAGSTYQGPRASLPAIVFLMRKFPLLDIDNSLASNATRSADEQGYPGNTDACGTTAQFQAYVERLKADTKSSVSEP